MRWCYANIWPVSSCVKDTRTVSTRTEALRELAGASFATLLLDVKLPDGDGLDMLAGLCDERRPARTVVMTAFSTPENDARAQHLNVYQLLRKPLDLQQLMGAVGGEAAAERHSPSANFSMR